MTTTSGQRAWRTLTSPALESLTYVIETLTEQRKLQAKGLIQSSESQRKALFTYGFEFALPGCEFCITCKSPSLPGNGACSRGASYSERSRKADPPRTAPRTIYRGNQFSTARPSIPFDVIEGSHDRRPGTGNGRSHRGRSCLQFNGQWGELIADARKLGAFMWRRDTAAVLRFRRRKIRVVDCSLQCRARVHTA